MFAELYLDAHDANAAGDTAKVPRPWRLAFDAPVFGRNPILKNLAAADLLNLVPIEETLLDLERRHVADARTLHIPVTRDGRRILAAEHRVEDGWSGTEAAKHATPRLQPTPISWAQSGATTGPCRLCGSRDVACSGSDPAASQTSRQGLYRWRERSLQE